jgi:hypothetical protein
MPSSGGSAGAGETVGPDGAGGGALGSPGAASTKLADAIRPVIEAAMKRVRMTVT